MLNPIIETAIGLVFVYLLFSMVCSSIQEFLAALFAWRAKTLRGGVKNMLSQDEDLTDKIYNDPFIKSLARQSWWDKLTGKDPRPSYIPADLFAKALINAVGINVSDPTAKPVFTADSKLPADTQKVLQSFAVYSPDLNTLLANIEDWFNNAMDRVSGWYKRKTQSVILLIAVAVAVGFNADTLMLATAFWHDPALRTAAVSAAADYVKTHQGQAGGQQNQITEQQKAEYFPSVTSPGEAPVPPREETLEQTTKNLSDTLTDVQAQLTKINLPLGWVCEPCSDANRDKSKNANLVASEKAPTQMKKNACNADEQKAVEANAKCVRGQKPQDGWSWLVKTFGLLLTVLALSQGAPFWFDLLQKLVNLRLAGNPPPDKKSTT